MIVSALRKPWDSPGEGDVRVPDAVGGQVGGDRLGLGRRDDRVVEPLEQQHRAGQVVDVADRRALHV